MEPEGKYQDKRGEISLEEQVDGEKTVTGSLNPEIQCLPFESSSAGAGVKTPEQLRLSCGEIRSTTVDGCRHAGGEGSEQGGIISLQAIVNEEKKTRRFTMLTSCRWAG